MSGLPRLMLVTDRRRCAGRDLVEVVAAAGRGGLRLVQVREKDLADRAFRELMDRLRAQVPETTTLIVNGRADVAASIGSGVHLPASSVAGGESRPAATPTGCSCHNEEELRTALGLRPDYLVVGTVFPTRSKPGRPALGTNLLRCLVRIAGDTPVYAIGGMRPERVASVLGAGAYGVAVSGYIQESADPERAVGRLLRSIRERCTLER